MPCPLLSRDLPSLSGRNVNEQLAACCLAKSIRIHEVNVDVEVGTEKRLKGPLVCGTYVQTHNLIPFSANGPRHLLRLCDNKHSPTLARDNWTRLNLISSKRIANSYTA